MMKATSTSETSVNFYQNIRRYNEKDSHLHTRRHENLKSWFEINSFNGLTSVLWDEPLLRNKVLFKLDVKQAYFL
jgi:hypothetical protein